MNLTGVGWKVFRTENPSLVRLRLTLGHADGTRTTEEHDVFVEPADEGAQ